MSAKILKPEEFFKEFTEYLDEDIKKFNKGNHYAAYGYFCAFHEMGMITLEQWSKLSKRLDLTVDEIDEILL